MLVRGTAVAALLATLAACSTGMSGQQPPTAEGDGFANAPLVPGAGTGDLETCRTRRLGVRVSREAGRKDGRVSAVVILTNTGVTGCALIGWPTIALADNGKNVSVTTSRVAEPTSTVDIALDAGSSAFAGARWTPCEPGSVACDTGTQLLLAAPGSDLVPAELSDFSLAERRRLAIKDVVVGSLQPTRSGVTDW